MLSSEIRKKFLQFFAEKNHYILPSASLVPENDPTVLFTTAGMHPLVPFFMGEPHPGGTRLASCQKCIRTIDIDSVGDRWHLTFFEMLGNWSLGDYFKKESIAWSYEFLISKKWLGIDPERISVTVFEGDDLIPRDDEAKNIWLDAGIPEERIFYRGREDNWWGPAGKTGPCGPDSEIYYDTGIAPCGPTCSPTCNCGKHVEIWNNVFMVYNKTAEGKYELLKQKNVDTGMGLDRITAVLQGKKEVFETDLLLPLMNKIKSLVKQERDTSMEIIADHIRAAVFIISDGVSPSNIEQGYVLRRLIRRAIRHAKNLGIETDFCSEIANEVINIYQEQYPVLQKNKSEIIMELVNEEEKFRKTLNHGLRKFNLYFEKDIDNKTFSSQAAFDLFQSYGFPIEMTQEEAAKNGLTVDIEEFNKKLAEHQNLSKEKAVGKFAGGLADSTEQSKKYHTATHLLHQALRLTLGDHVKQKGSNINEHRMRFDFTQPMKMTPEQIKNVENIVNEKIQQNLIVKCEEMPLDKAQEQGAIGLFANKYGDRVKVYTIGDFSKEICGGPHVEKTTDLGHFKILKEEASSSGVRRIKAILE